MSDELPTRHGTQNFYTHSALQSPDDEIKLKFYESIIKSNSIHPYRYFVTLTFSKPTVEPTAVYITNRYVRRFIERKLYSRRAKKCDLKFAFFVEPHLLKHKQQNKLHVHFLMTECKDSLLNLHLHIDERYQLLKLQFTLKDIFKRIYCFDNRNCANIQMTKLKHVYSTTSLTDYLLKELRRPLVTDITSMIDVENSDLVF